MSDDSPLTPEEQEALLEAQKFAFTIQLSSALCECVEGLVRHRGDDPEIVAIRNAYAEALDAAIEAVDAFLPEADVFDTINRVWFALEPVTHVREEQA